MLMICVRKIMNTKGDIKCQDCVSYFKCWDQEFLTQKVILSTYLKEKIMLKIYDPFLLENWALDSCICYILGTSL